MKISLTGRILTGVLWLASASSAASITNGSFEAQAADVPAASCSFPSVTGWSTSSFSTLCATGYFGAAPPDGTIFATVGDNDPGLDRGGDLAQIITGLTVGDTYIVTFDLASGNEVDLNTVATEDILVSMLSGSSSPSQTYTGPASSIGNLYDKWASFTYSFVPTATSAQIDFVETAATAGTGDVGLDAVSIADSGVAAPEPATMALFGSGLLLLGILRRRLLRR